MVNNDILGLWAMQLKLMYFVICKTMCLFLKVEMNEWMNEWMHEWMNDWMNEWIKGVKMKVCWVSCEQWFGKFIVKIILLRKCSLTAAGPGLSYENIKKHTITRYRQAEAWLPWSPNPPWQHPCCPWQPAFHCHCPMMSSGWWSSASSSHSFSLSLLEPMMSQTLLELLLEQR